MDTLVGGLKRMHHATTINTEKLVMRMITVCQEMLTDRGCTNIQCPSTHVEVETLVDESQPVIVADTPRTRILFHTEERIAVKYVRSLLDDNDEFERTIIVSLEGPTSFARKEIQNSVDMTIQFFKYKELSVNITKHVCVPKHERIDDTSFEYETSKCPTLSLADIVSRYYDYKIGDLIRVRRRFGTTDASDYYRIVTA